MIKIIKNFKKNEEKKSIELIHNKEELTQERKRKALVQAILNRFCQCETKDNIKIHLQNKMT